MTPKLPKKMSAIAMICLETVNQLSQPSTTKEIRAALPKTDFTPDQLAKTIANLATRGYLDKKMSAEGMKFKLSKKGKFALDNKDKIEIVTSEEMRKPGSGRPKGSTNKEKPAAVTMQAESSIPEYNVSAVADQFSELATQILIQNNRYRQIAVRIIKHASTNMGLDDCMVLRQSLVNIIQLASTILTEEEKQTLI